MFTHTVKLSLVMALSLLLAACFNAKEDQAVAKSDTRLNIAMLMPPRAGLSPLSDDAFKLSRWSTAETLVSLDEKANAKPLLATKWQQVNETTWQFTLRQNVIFHDGSAFNAKAVENSLQKAFQAAPKPRILNGQHWQIRAIDAFRLEIQTEFNDPLLPSRLSSPQLAILSAKAYQEKNRVNPSYAGTGPFVLTEINGATSAKLSRFDGYWGAKAKLENVFVEYVPDGFARAAALRTGKSDIVEAVPVSQAAMIDNKLLHQVPMPRTNTLYLNHTSKVFSQLALRKAAAQAIDKAKIISIVYENRADIAKGLLGPALAWAESARVQHPLKESQVSAKAKGEKIVIGTFTDRAELPEVAALLKQQLEAAGFSVQLDIREYAQIENDALAGKFDAFLLSRATVLDSGDPIAYMQSDFGCEGGFNLGQFCAKEVDSALKFADSQPLGEARQNAIIAAEAKILEQYAAIPLLHEHVIQGESSRVKNVHRDPRERRLIDEFTDIN